MPRYKVGDLASLFPVPPKKDKQPLITQVKEEPKFQKKVKKQNSENQTEMTISGNKKGTKRKKFSEENEISPKKLKWEKTEEKPKFKRSKKKYRKVHLDSAEMETADVKTDDLFCVDPTPDVEENSEDQPKQLNKNRKKKKLKYDNSFSSETLGEIKQEGRENSDKHDPTIKQEKNNVQTESDKDLASTLFVGNLPLSVSKKMLVDQFARFGAIKNIRFRGAIPVKSGIPKKVAEIKQQYNTGMKNHIAYVVYKDSESAQSALSLNGTQISEHHIIVDFAKNAGEKKMYDNNLSIFIGSLPYDVSDEDVWTTFEACGDIHAVRVIRDKHTGVGKGIGYVQFKSVDAKQKALSMKDVEIGGRQIRIKCVESGTPRKESSKKALMKIRSNIAQSRGHKKKSVKKLLKKGRREHHHKKVAKILLQRK